MGRRQHGRGPPTSQIHGRCCGRSCFAPPSLPLDPCPSDPDQQPRSSWMGGRCWAPSPGDEWRRSSERARIYGTGMGDFGAEKEIERATTGSCALGQETASPYSAPLGRRRRLGPRAESVASRDDGLPLSPQSIRSARVFFAKIKLYRQAL
jgi:hypothetical protein